MNTTSQLKLNPTVIHSLRALSMVDLALERGATLTEILKRTNITKQQYLERRLAITVPEFANLCQNAIDHFNNTDFALEHGSRINITARGPLGLVLMSLPNFRAVLNFAINFQKLLNVPHKGEIERTNQGIELTLSYIKHVNYSNEMWRFNVECILLSFIKTAQYLTNQNFTLVGAQFAYPEPSYSEAYKTYFNCPIEFGAKTTTIIFPRELDDTPLVTANKTIAEDGAKQCNTALKEIIHSKRTASRIRALLKASNDEYPDLQQISKRLFLTDRSVRRRLADEGTCFQEILDAVRKDRAKIMLANHNYSVEAIAKSVGFSDASNFRKAFKRWTKVTPSEYRKSALESA